MIRRLAAAAFAILTLGACSASTATAAPCRGLNKDWAFQVIRQVGANHEMFRRDIGQESSLKLDRGLNALWNAPNPGLLYAPPFR